MGGWGGGRAAVRAARPRAGFLEVSPDLETTGCSFRGQSVRESAFPRARILLDPPLGYFSLPPEKTVAGM